MRPILALALACAAAGCSRAPATNVVLLVADTLRADALACDGGSARTPHLCRLAEQGALFERAYSPAPWTAPSAVALFTGSHAAGYSDRAPGEREATYHVPADEHVLAERLAERGYELRFDLDNGLAYYSNALQGFVALDVRAPEAAAAVPAGRGEEERALRMGASIHYLATAREPFYAMRWILDPHAPYGPPPERLAALAPLAEGLPRPLSFYAGLGHHNAEHRLRKIAPSLSPPERALVRRLYDEEVAYVDERVGWLLAELDRRALWERTFVIFTSDHGEAFGEHGLWLHGKSLQEALLRVPLLIAGPGVPAGLRVAAPVSLTDLQPTLCAWLAEDCGDAQGASFAELLAGKAHASAEREVYAGAPNDPGRGLDALIVGPWKLLAKADGSVELFDLAADPGEERDLAAAQPERAARLAARLAEIRAANEARRERRLAGRDPEQLEAVRKETRRGLEALGYVE